MATKTVVPFGPQHPVLPEPIHLDLVLEDEKVVKAIPSIGFIHRGLEKLAEKRDYLQMTYVAERICGICSFIHAAGYCQGIEALMKIEVPRRAEYLRVIWGEMSRIHSHLLWLGLLADSFGFESIFMHSWRVRERLLDIVEETTGGRVIFGSCKVGGVRKDIDAETMKRVVAELATVEKMAREITSVCQSDSSVKRRTCGVGVLDTDKAHKLGAAGPTLRASGIAYDMRMLGYGAYPDLAFEPVVETAGDSYARMMVRIREIYQSFDLIRKAATKIPAGPVDVKVTGNPSGEYFSRVEQPRGDVVYFLRGNGSKLLTRFRVRTPTFANVPPLVAMLEGCQFADVPVIVLSIDPCISCTER